MAAIAMLVSGCATPPDDLPPARVGSTVERKTPPTPSPRQRIVPPQPHAPTIEPAERPSPRMIAAAQVMLDRANLSPGVVDGILGSRTRSALRAWQEMQGLPATGELDSPTRETLGPEEPAFTVHVVSEDDRKGLGPVPRTWLGRSQAEALGYETVLERLAETYHCSQAMLRQLNPNAAWPDPPAETVLAAPNPYPSRTARAANIHISLGQKTVRVYDADDKLVALFPCSIGRSTMQSPTGEMSVVAAAENPNYYFDPRVFPEDEEAQRMTGKLVIPPGPNNPVGVAWISLSRPGYGMHGTPHPEDIGKTESHGCIRLANWNAAKLVKMISVGMPVIIEE